MWWAYLLSAFFGGIVAIVAAIIALTIAAKSGNLVSIHFGNAGCTFYKDLELLDSDVRYGGIYVKYKNTGDKTTTAACFRVKLYDEEGRLFAESEDTVFDEIAPDEIQEHMIKFQALDAAVLHDPKNRVEIQLRYVP